MARLSPAPTSGSLSVQRQPRSLGAGQKMLVLAVPRPAPRTAPPARCHRCVCRAQMSPKSLILGLNVRIFGCDCFFVFLFVFFQKRGGRSPGQLCMDTRWWRHWAKLGVCCWLSLDCCINLSALQCSTTSLPLLFPYLPPPFLSLSLSSPPPCTPSTALKRVEGGGGVDSQ